MKKHPKHSRYWAEDLSRRWFQIDRWYRQPKYVWDREHETSIQTIQSLHGVQMVAWPLKAGEDMIVSISVTEAMALSAALRTSCEHPGFTMLFTFVCGQGKNWSANTLYHFWKGKKLTTKLVKYLLQVLLQLFDSSHVVLVFNTQWNRLCLSTRSFKLKWPRVSVDVFHQEAGRILSQQSGKQNLSTRHKSSRTYRFRKGESQRLEKELVIN